jgi:RNA polymerase sigma-70 factor (ECF subfamily)
MAATRSDPTSPTDFATLFDQEFSYVWNSLLRLGVSERDVEDVTHEVFLLVHRSLSAYDPTRPIRPWLFGFAHRVAADYRRLARHRLVLVGDLADLESSGRSETAYRAALATGEAVAVVHQALAQLPLDQRAVFVLHDLDGHLMKVVAEALGISANTGYSRLRAAGRASPPSSGR